MNCINYLSVANLKANAALNILSLLMSYPWMRGWCVEGEEKPQQAPEDSDTASCVEDNSPAIMGDEKPTQEVRQPDAETEP